MNKKIPLQIKTTPHHQIKSSNLWKGGHSRFGKKKTNYMSDWILEFRILLNDTKIINGSCCEWLAAPRGLTARLLLTFFITFFSFLFFVYFFGLSLFGVTSLFLCFSLHRFFLFVYICFFHFLTFYSFDLSSLVFISFYFAFPDIFLFQLSLLSLLCIFITYFLVGPTYSSQGHNTFSTGHMYKFNTFLSREYFPPRHSTSATHRRWREYAGYEAVCTKCDGN